MRNKRNKFFRKKSISILTLSVIAAMSGFVFSPVAQAALITQHSDQALIVTETDTQSNVQTTASVGPLTNNGGAQQLAVSGAAGSAALTDSLTVVPYNGGLYSTVFPNNTAALNAVNSYLGDYTSQIVDAVVGAMNNQSISNSGSQVGFFTFIQDVQVSNPSGNVTTEQVYGTFVIHKNGDYLYLGTSMNDSTVYILYGIYQQSDIASYLPAGWTVPDAGEFQWELLNITFEGGTETDSPVSVGGQDWHTINDNGAYNAASSTNPNTGVTVSNYGPAVQSLITNQFYPLMQQYNANYGILEYGEKVQAARDPATGQLETALSFTNRVFTSVCGANSTLNNSGQYGYLLQETLNVYLVQNATTYTSENPVIQTTISPTNSFNVTADLPNGAQYSSYVNDVVLPTPAQLAGQVVNWQAGYPFPATDYVAPMAPLTNNSTAGAGNSNIDTAFGDVNVCVSPNDYVLTSPEYYALAPTPWGGKYGTYTTGYDYAEISPLYINGTLDSAYLYYPWYSLSDAYNMYSNYGVGMDWDPGDDITQEENGNYIIYPDIGYYAGDYPFYVDVLGGPDYLATAGFPSANVPSTYTFAAASGGEYNCSPSGCTYNPPFTYYKY